CRIEEPFGAVDVEHGAARKDVDTVFRDVPHRGLPALAPEAARFGQGLYAGGVATGGGDDVDHGEEGVPSVESRAGTANHLDVIDGFEIDAEILAEVPLLVDVVVVRVAVHQQQDAVVRVVRTEEAADTDVLVAAIVARVEPGDRPQRLGQRAVAEQLD